MAERILNDDDNELGAHINDLLPGALPGCDYLVCLSEELTMLCPKCNRPNVLMIAEEVDIGVGIQKFLTGAECDVCGQIACCPTCNAWIWDGHEQHYDWCEFLKKET